MFSIESCEQKIGRTKNTMGKQTRNYFILPFVFVNLEDEQPQVNFFKTILPLDEREIIDSIAQNGTERKRGEERLFNRYAYFIKEAVYKYSLPQEDAFDLYSDT